MLLIVLLQSLLLDFALILNNLSLTSIISARVHDNGSKDHGMPEWSDAM